jgi:hypothetical protein
MSPLTRAIDTLDASITAVSSDWAPHMEDILLKVLHNGEFLETRHSGRLRVKPSDRSRVSMWSPPFRLVVSKDSSDSMFPLRVTAPEILVTVRARATG